MWSGFKSPRQQGAGPPHGRWGVEFFVCCLIFRYRTHTKADDEAGRRSYGGFPARSERVQTRFEAPAPVLPPLHLSPHVFLINIYTLDGQIRIKRSSKCIMAGGCGPLWLLFWWKRPRFGTQCARPDFSLSPRVALHVHDLLPGRGKEP
jgi:hypothetical protein